MIEDNDVPYDIFISHKQAKCRDFALNIYNEIKKRNENLHFS
jgi:hypothetical protein